MRDPIKLGILKRIDRAQLLRLDSLARNAGFSGRRGEEWILAKVGPQGSLTVRPLLWENSPSRCLRCSVVFDNREHGLGQLLLDVELGEFKKLRSIKGRESRRWLIALIDRVKILNPSLEDQ